MNILLILTSVFLNALAQILIRKGMLMIGQLNTSNLIQAVPTVLTSFFLWCAGFCYAISLAVWIIALSRVEVSFALPFHCLSFIITAIAGYYFFHENVNLLRIIGILIIGIGVYLVSRS